jgi:hypothetical protein
MQLRVHALLALAVPVAATLMSAAPANAAQSIFDASKANAPPDLPNERFWNVFPVPT